MRFGLGRGLVAIVVFFALLALMDYFWFADGFLALMIATPVALIVLIAKPFDVRRIFRCVVCTGIGGVVGAGYSTLAGLPYEPSAEFRNIIFGVLFGGMIASVIELFDRAR